MADEQISVAAPEKYTEFFIWQTGLHRHRYKICTIKFLYTIRKGQPAKVVPVKFNIADSGYGLRGPVSYTHLRAHETVLDLVCRLLLEKKNKTNSPTVNTIVK